MGVWKNRETPEAERETFHPDLDRYPTAVQVLRRLLEEANIPDGPVDYLEVNVLADGGLTIKVRKPRAETSDGDYLEPA